MSKRHVVCVGKGHIDLIKWCTCTWAQADMNDAMATAHRRAVDAETGTELGGDVLN